MMMQLSYIRHWTSFWQLISTISSKRCGRNLGDARKVINAQTKEAQKSEEKSKTFKISYMMV